MRYFNSFVIAVFLACWLITSTTAQGILKSRTKARVRNIVNDNLQDKTDC